MQRAPWTLVKWCSKRCEYVKRRVKEPLTRLVPKSLRISSIDKIDYNPPDPRIPEFVHALNGPPKTTQDLLSTWASSMDHDTLEEFALVLALHKGLEIIPSTVRNRLKTLGMISDHVSSRENNTRNRELSESVKNMRPIDILSLSLPECDPQTKQSLIDQASNYGSISTELEKAWLVQLQGIRPQRTPDKILNLYLPFDEQCRLVSRELATVSAQIAATSFPRSLATLCRKLGDSLESAMLRNIAFKEGLPYANRRSRYLWGVIGQPRWTSKQRITIGSWWLEQALKLCRFTTSYQGRPVSRPAFWRTWYMTGSTKRGIFVLNQSLLKQLRQTREGFENLITSSQIPLLVPPRPWTGLHATNVPVAAQDLTLIASQGHSTEGQACIREAIISGAMQPHLDGLNRLSQQAWRINTDLLDIIIRLDPQVEAANRKNMPVQWQQALKIARALGSQKFYLPMYLDFRGRAYAASGSILNYMGKDVVRALFMFGEAKELGHDGLHWLEVHLANMYGKCKSQTQQEKRNWVRLNRDNIVQSADQPLKNNWWRSGKKPFQTLAACLELSRAWDHADPLRFKSQLPVQIDGTCNGLQHLVSLARDEKNARHVNVVESNGCGDIYGAVARAVSEGQDPIERCVVKDAVMTYFYGASLYHMQESLRNNHVPAPVELANRIRDCLNEMLAPERQIQHWLLDCAQRITNACRADQSEHMAAMAWTSPLGMPVVQPYVKPKLMVVRTPLQSFYLPSKFHQLPIDRKKQLAGVVANFVHSLDAAHMLATSRALPETMSFAAVHDSFWTHASDVPVLGRILREQFVQIHSLDLLAGLREEWMERYRGFMVLGKVHLDSPLYEKVVWQRSGVTCGRKQQACLDNELRQWYEGNPPLVPDEPVKWDSGTPYVGTPGRPSIKLWFPLDLAPIPPRGSLDIRLVMYSPFFFS